MCPLVHQCRNCCLPSLVDFSEHVGDRHSHVREEDFVESGITRHLPQGSDGNPFTLHINEKRGNSFMLRHARIGPHQQETPVSEVRQAGPGLLPVDDELIAVPNRLRSKRGDIAPCIRL